MSAGHMRTRKCSFCKETIVAWVRTPQWCCDEYRKSIQGALAKALIPPVDPPKKPHPFTGRKGPL